jgi:hypothetical protein
MKINILNLTVYLVENLTVVHQGVEENWDGIREKTLLLQLRDEDWQPVAIDNACPILVRVRT